MGLPINVRLRGYIVEVRPAPREPRPVAQPGVGRRGRGKQPGACTLRTCGKMTRRRLLCLGWSCADLSPMQTRCRRDLRGLGTRLRVLAAEFAQLRRPQCALILKALLLTLRPA